MKTKRMNITKAMWKALPPQYKGEATLAWIKRITAIDPNESGDAAFVGPRIGAGVVDARPGRYIVCAEELFLGQRQHSYYLFVITERFKVEYYAPCLPDKDFDDRVRFINGIAALVW